MSLACSHSGEPSGSRRIARLACNLASGTWPFRIALSPLASEAMKAGLKKAMDLRWELNKTTREVQEQQAQLQVIVQDQERLRKNLKEMPPTAAAYKRYLQKFDDQETEIERLQEQTKKLQETASQQQKEYEEYLTGLTVE